MTSLNRGTIKQATSLKSNADKLPIKSPLYSEITYCQYLQETLTIL
ncbi:hypothetical protein C4K30_4281 [Pseudomonas chlororaphis subsp. piscium]|nr:hypothetical protein C4K30_4281 [Pseudomonas chlororaphis subsp. piscium]